MKFVPGAYQGAALGFSSVLTQEKTGTVVQVNRARRWYRVEYRYGDPSRVGYECFKF